jgi:hypothetical protein
MKVLEIPTSSFHSGIAVYFERLLFAGHKDKFEDFVKIS